MALPVQTNPTDLIDAGDFAALAGRQAPEALVVASDAIVAEALALALSACGVAARVAAALPLRPVAGRGGAAVVLLGGAGAPQRTVAALVGAGRRVAVLAGPDEPGLPACVAAGAEAVVPTAGALNALVTVLSGLAHDGPVESPVALDALLGDRSRCRVEAEILASLTPREGEILALLAAGRRADAIARSSFVSLHTVRTQIRSILRKLDVHSQLEAVAIAHRAGWAAGAGSR